MNNNQLLRLQLLVISIVIYLPIFYSATAAAQVNTSHLVIKNVNAIDVISGEVIYHRDIVIRDKMIIAIHPSPAETLPPNTVFIDGSGKYLLPGLWDMHFHLCWDRNNDTLLFPLLLKNGITGIRDMGGDLTITRTFKARLRAGKITGPEVYGAGPMIDGIPPVHPDFTLPVGDKSNIKYLLDSLTANGADFFKVYSFLKENQLKAIAAYCSSNHTSFAGHLSEYVEPELAITLGQKSIEHLNRLDNIWETNQQRMDSIGELMIRKKAFLCPTLITYQLKTRLRDSSTTRPAYDRYIPSSLMKEWKMNWEGRIKRHTKNKDWEGLDKTFISQMALVNFLNKKGVLLLAGSDFAGMPYVYPGIGLHEELSLLVNAGLSNQQALRTATINPAIYLLAQQLYGSITVGKYADLILLERNPLEDIKNTQAINTVILKGKVVYDSAVVLQK